MKNCPFCNIESQTNNAPPSAGFFRRVWRTIQWITPTTILIVMPKCPICVAMYVALFTGLGISIATARLIQILLAIICGGALVYPAIGSWRRRKARGFAISSD